MFRKILKKLRLPQKGQGLVEYALILVLIAVVVIAILLTVGPAISQVYCRVAGSLQPGSCSFGVTITSGPTATPAGPGHVHLSISVQVPEATSVTFSAGGKTATESSCNTSCTLTVNGIVSSGTWAVTTGAGGSAGGSY